MDSEEVSGESVIGTGNDARLKLYDQIADGVDEARDDELRDVDTEDYESRSKPKEEPAEQAEEAKPEPTTYRLKINGVERDYKIEEVLAAAQKVESADEHLRNAKAIAERLEQVSKQTEPSQPRGDVPPQEVEPDDLALARALQMGTEEEAAKVIRKLRSPTPSVKPDEIVQQAVSRVEFQNAFNWFQSEYQDIFADENLRQLAFARDEALLKQGDNRPYRERFKAVGDELRAWRGIKPSQTFEEKAAKKSATVVNIKTASAKTAAPADDDADESVSDVIAKMARARGQV
jgi:hypothetical protein